MTNGTAPWRACAHYTEVNDEASLRLVAKGERVLQAYEDIRNALRASNDRAEAALADAEKWKAATHEIEAIIPLAYTHVLASARAVASHEERLNVLPRAASTGSNAAHSRPASGKLEHS